MIERKNDAVTLSCHKMKDAQEFKPMKFNPEIVTIGGKPDDPITSLYLSESNDYAKQIDRVSPQMRDSLKLLDLMNRKSGISCKSDWMNLCRDEEVYTKAAFYNAINTMESRNIIKITGYYVKRY